MEDVLFTSTGNVEDAVATMGTFISRPAMRELSRLDLYYDAIVDAGDGLLRNDHDVVPKILDNLKHFLALSSGGGQDSETDNAIRATAAALVGTADEMKGKKAAYERLLGLTHRRVTDAITQRGATLTSSGKGKWRRRTKAEYSNRYGDSVTGVIDEFLHSVGRPDNSSHRGEVKVPIGINEADGTVTYDLHPPLTIPDAEELFDVLTGRDHTREKVWDEDAKEWLHPRVRDPDPHWGRVAELNKKRKKPLKLSAKLIRSMICDCMGRPRTYKCADTKRFLFEQMLALFHKSSEVWHRRGRCTCGCDRDAVRKWSATPFASLSLSMCPRGPVKEFALPEYDSKTGMPTGKMRPPPTLHKLECHTGKCSKCGWSSVFAGCPMHNVNVAGVDHKVQACAVDASTDTSFSWYTWQRIPRMPPPTIETDGDADYEPPSTNKTCYSTYWFPVTGTRADFMVALQSAFEDYREHMFWVQWHALHKERAEDRLMISPAVLGQAGVEPWQRNWIFAHTDFAATITVARTGEKTGAIPQVTQLLVSVITHDPRLMKTSDLKKGARKNRLERDGIISFPTADTTVVFGFSNAKHDTQFYHSVMAQAMEVLHTGKAPSGSKMEFVFDGVRLAGSDATRKLREGLEDHDAAKHGEPKPFILTGHSGISCVRLDDDRKSFLLIPSEELPTVEQCTKMLESRDGCKAQFQGLHAFLHYCLFERITSVALTNVCCEANDGKGAADGCSRNVSQGARSLALQGYNSGSESRGLFELLAAMRPWPKVARGLKDSFFAVTNYLYVYAGDPDGSSFADCRAGEGYKGSSKDHHYTMAPETRGAGPKDCDRGYVQHMTRPCPCDSCLKGDVANCEVKRLFANHVDKKRTERYKGVAKRAATRSGASQYFINGVQRGDLKVIVVRVHKEEPQDDVDSGEPYYLAVMDKGDEEQELCWRNNKTQDVGMGNVVNKSVWLIRFRWLHYRPGAVAASPEAAHNSQYRGYQFQPGETTVVYPVFGVITKKDTCAAAQDLKEADGIWWLPKKAHEFVVKDGLDLLA
jgi:hypothetical protein